ncbi:MAG: hypothetical protein DMG58_12920 [Acidobacteria bacterium]|nr:MAG: hypothetical protein DMG58_12920 [Acidobacteriota bacterium]
MTAQGIVRVLHEGTQVAEWPFHIGLAAIVTLPTIDTAGLENHDAASLQFQKAVATLPTPPA